jgi:uncharacterized membrane protein
MLKNEPLFESLESRKLQMNPTDISDTVEKTSNDRLVMQILYGLHTLAWFSGGVFAVVALIINYLRRADEVHPLYVAWTLVLLVLLSPLWLFFFLPGMLAYALVWLWYLYRCLKGWLRFNSNRLAQPVVSI